MKDVVNHPSHYESNAVKIEPIDITAVLPHPIASAFEYCIRAGKKENVPELQDLEKARFWVSYFFRHVGTWRIGGRHLPKLDAGDLSILTKFAETFEFARVIGDRYRLIYPASDSMLACVWEDVAGHLLTYIDKRIAGLKGEQK